MSTDGNGRVWGSWSCKKRDGRSVRFEIDKIRRAALGCFSEIGLAGDVADVTADAVAAGVVAKLSASGKTTFGVEHVQRLVIQWLWANDLFDAAEAYQNHREHHRKKRELNTACVFDRRPTFKPFDYPEAVRYKEAIQHSFWLVSEVSFDADVQNFRVDLTDAERGAVRNALLAISQIEVSVKKFWTKLGDRFQRAEFDQVGVTFGESEVRHSDAYARLIEVLGLEHLFDGVQKVPAVRARIDYLTRALAGASGGDDRSFVKTLAMFVLFVENVSLFSQFAVIKSFAKHRNKLQSVDTVVQWTQKEELVHAMFGTYLINLVRAERPEWFGEAFYDDLVSSCREAVEAETAIVDWILEAGELPFLKKDALVEFVKDRVNDGITSIGGPKVFDIDHAKLEGLKWFVEEIHTQVDVDKFHKRSPNYSSRNAPVTAGDLF